MPLTGNWKRSISVTVTPQVIGRLKREQIDLLNSTLLHELYFASLGGDGRTLPGMNCQRDRRDFRSVAIGARIRSLAEALAGGAGWVLLTYVPRDGRLINQSAADHTRASPAASRSSRSTCTSTPIISISARMLRPTSPPSCATSIGRRAGALRRCGKVAPPRLAGPAAVRRRAGRSRPRKSRRWSRPAPGADHRYAAAPLRDPGAGHRRREPFGAIRNVSMSGSARFEGSTGRHLLRLRLSHRLRDCIAAAKAAGSMRGTWPVRHYAWKAIKGPVKLFE